MKTFAVQTLGCKVNQYEGEQIAALLRARGLVETDAACAELRVVNTCSVTVQAGSKSRQTARRNVRLPLLSDLSPSAKSGDADHCIVEAPGAGNEAVTLRRARVVLTGCWATSDRSAAAALRGVDAVLTHQDDVAAELDRLLLLWRSDEGLAKSLSARPSLTPNYALPHKTLPIRPGRRNGMDGSSGPVRRKQANALNAVNQYRPQMST